MNSRLVYLFFLALLAAVSIFAILPNRNDREPGDVNISSEDRDRQELIFLLQYIGRDYQNAVVEGVVINEFEYREIIAFCQRALESYLMFQQNLNQNLTLFQLQQLRQMAYEKVDRQSILDLTKTLIRDLAKEFDLETFPAMAPDIERGRLLYKAGGCRDCHGASGAGNGYAAEWLMPGPGSFREEARMNEATPYQFFNVIRLGVRGTGMPAYGQAFSKQEVWDVAFYLMTLRDGFDPRLTGDRPDITLEDLATKSDFNLLHQIKDRQQPLERTNEAQEGAMSAAIDFLRNKPDAMK